MSAGDPMCPDCGAYVFPADTPAQAHQCQREARAVRFRSPRCVSCGETAFSWLYPICHQCEVDRLRESGKYASAPLSQELLSLGFDETAKEDT